MAVIYACTSCERSVARRRSESPTTAEESPRRTAARSTAVALPVPVYSGTDAICREQFWCSDVLPMVFVWSDNQSAGWRDERTIRSAVTLADSAAARRCKPAVAPRYTVLCQYGRR